VNIKKKLKVSLWKTPFFFFKSLVIFIKLTKSGALVLILNSQFETNKFKSIIHGINFLIYRGKKEEIGINLLNCLTKLGPGYIKLGQALSTRPDIIGNEISKHLKKLQDDIDPFCGLLAKSIIERESKLLIADTFTLFNLEPIASASVAQVHKAILKNGEKVAVKILRPGIEKKLFSDFQFFYWGSKLIEFCMPRIKRLKLSQTVEVFSKLP